MSTERQPENASNLVISGLVLSGSGGAINIALDVLGFNAVDWLFIVTGTGTELAVEYLGERDFGVFEATPIDATIINPGPVADETPLTVTIDFTGTGTRRAWTRGVPTAGPEMNISLIATGTLTISVYAYRRIMAQGQFTM